MKTILITFADAEERDSFLQSVTTLDDEVVKRALNTVKLDVPLKEDSERFCTMFVSGQKICEGPLQEMQTRFAQEIASHSGSVVLKELRGGEWQEIRARRLQTQ